MKELARKAFGERLRAARKDLGLNQAQIAEHLGTKPSTVSRWETGISFPERGHFEALCAYLRKSPEYFMGESQPAPQNVLDLTGVIRRLEEERMSLAGIRDILDILLTLKKPELQDVRDFISARFPDLSASEQKKQSP